MNIPIKNPGKRLMGIDYGTKRTGIAITDELQLIASGLTTVSTPELFDYLTNYFQKNPVEKVVVGMPKQMDNTESQSSGAIKQFMADFAKRFPLIELVQIDERFTSKMAFQTMIDSGLKKKQRQNKALVDEIAATIILRDFMDARTF